MNRLYYGDNLTVLRGSIDDESVDLIYLVRSAAQKTRALDPAPTFQQNPADKKAKGCLKLP